MKMSWTPGPWQIMGSSEPDNVGGRDYAIVVDGDHIISEVFERTSLRVRQPAEANARLIASSPELADALERTLRIVEESRDSSLAKLRQIGIMARAALTNARGEKP